MGKDREAWWVDGQVWALRKAGGPHPALDTRIHPAQVRASASTGFTCRLPVQSQRKDRRGGGQGGLGLQRAEEGFWGPEGSYEQVGFKQQAVGLGCCPPSWGSMAMDSLAFDLCATNIPALASSQLCAWRPCPRSSWLCLGAPWLLCPHTCPGFLFP